MRQPLKTKHRDHVISENLPYLGAEDGAYDFACGRQTSTPKLEL